jgi:hypothetical protein
MSIKNPSPRGEKSEEGVARDASHTLFTLQVPRLFDAGDLGADVY